MEGAETVSGGRVCSVPHRCPLGITNNDNEYLVCQTRTGPKRLHVLYRQIHIVKIQRIQDEGAHTHTHACTH